MTVRNRIARAGAVGALGVALLLGAGAGTAGAHTAMKSSSPKAGATVGRSLRGVATPAG
jgi:hypothetical protein